MQAHDSDRVLGRVSILGLCTSLFHLTAASETGPNVLARELHATLA